MPFVLIQGAYAYSSPYYASRLYDPLGPGYQGSQVVAKGNTVYVSSYTNCLIYKLINNQEPSIIAGVYGHCGTSPDGSIATQSPLGDITSVDVGPDGTVYFTQPDAHYVRAVLPDGTLATIAGNGTQSSVMSDASNAKQTAFNSPAYVKAGPDGSVYVYDSGVIRRILLDGSTDHVAGIFSGNADTNPYVEGGVANQHYFTSGQFSSVVQGASWCLFAFDPSGNLFASAGSSIYKINLSDDTIHTYYTTPSSPIDTLENEPMTSVRVSSMTGFDVDSQGRIWVAGGSLNTGIAIQYISPDDQVVRTAAGGGSVDNPPSVGNTPITGNSLRLGSLKSIAVSNDRIYYIGLNASNGSDGGNYVGTLNQDTTPPVIQGSPLPVPNSSGWNNSNTTITWSVSDPESPVTNQTGCSTITVTSETAGTAYTCTATSSGGTNSQPITIKIDKTAPTVSTPTVSGGVTLPFIGTVLLTNGTIRTNVSDNLSGVAGGEFYADTDPGQSHGTPLSVSGGTASATINISQLSAGPHNLYVRSYDKAGNWSNVSTPVVVTVL